MWKYIKNYLHFAVLAALFMVGEVTMDLLQPDIMSRIVDDGVLGIHNGGVGNMQVIVKLGFAMIALVLFGGFCGSMNNVFVHTAGQNIGNEMRKDCFRSIMSLSFQQTDRFSTGTLVTRVTNDITQVQNFVSQFIRGMIRTLMLTVGSIFFIFRLNGKFGLVVLCASPFILGSMVFCLKKANPFFLKLQSLLDEVNAVMQEDITGIRIVKACVRETYEKLRFGKANDELIKTQLRVLVIFAFMNPVMNAIMYLATVILILVGSSEVSLGAATPGAVMAAITYTTQLLHGMLMMVMIFQNIARGMASWKRIKELLTSEPALRDGGFDGDTGIHGQVEFCDVSFSYPGTEKTVLRHINLTINPGETVAVMGATGCGKTTLVNLISRFYDATDGAVLVDGVDVREYRQQALRKKVSVALQKSELFTASVRENISWGNPDAADEDIRSAAVIAQADSFISATPDGYETLVAERGMSLSGGQKQRVSIARAVLKPSEILILDDSTSALDLKTEAQLYDALSEQRAGMTKIIIAQRIASVRRADKIVVLENGTIAACGSHAELMASCDIYRDIYESQLGKEAEAHE